jgi:NADPH2:quinone reductase
VDNQKQIAESRLETDRETKNLIEQLLMKAVVITGAGGPEVLEMRDVPQPQAQAGEVLVRVRATALNRADVLQRQGRYPAPPGVPRDIPGLEFAGEVAACGPNANLWKPGQRVFGLVAGGSYAEYLLAHERTLAEIPANLDFEAAAAVPEAFITAQDALWTQAQLRPGERVLIHAAGSGVGLAAVQLVAAIGAQAYGTSRTADKIERAREYGLTDGAVIKDPGADLPPHVQRWTGSAGFNAVLELVGGPYIAASIDALGQKGRLILVGTVAGGKMELSVAPIMSKRLTIRGTVMRARPLEEKIAAARSFAAEVVPLLARGVLRPTVDRVFPLAEARQAHEYMESNGNFGKIVLRVG